eukprot:612327-Amphidinium_carterae.2
MSSKATLARGSDVIELTTNLDRSELGPSSANCRPMSDKYTAIFLAMTASRATWKCSTVSRKSANQSKTLSAGTLSSTRGASPSHGVAVVYR